MAVFRAFRAFRPAKGNENYIPELPYDVMSSDEARDVAKGNDLSFLHVDKAEIDLPRDTDLYDKKVYEKANENLLKLENTGALVQDETPCFYIYKQVMNGRSQVGIAGCASIDDYEDNVIKKHENTLAKKELDRINHVKTTNANTGPIFLTYRNKAEINAFTQKYMAENEPVYNFVHNGVLQTVWVVSNAEFTENLTALFADVSCFYIADGHHRCKSAVRVGQMKRQEKGRYTGEEEFNFFLAVAFPDSELEIMDYNRVVRDLNGLTSEQFINELSKDFTVEKATGQYKPNKKHNFGMLLDRQWYSVTAKEGVANESDPVGRLDVSILQVRVLAPILGITDPRHSDRIDFIGGIRGLGELERRTKTDMRVAFAMFPTTIDELMDIADAGEIMPQKSTWFEPKLLSGLFIHHLD